MIKVMLWALMGAAALYADFTLTVSTGGTKQVFLYKDSTHAKIRMAEQEMIVSGDKAYTLHKDEGQNVYYDVDEMRAFMDASPFGAMAGEQAKAAFDAADVTVLKKGGRAEVAGIKGEKWRVRMLDENGEAKESDIVVTDDKRIVKAMKAWMQVLERVMPSREINLADKAEIEPGYVAIRADDFSLSGYSEKKIPAAEIALPASAVKRSMGAPVPMQGRQIDVEALRRMMEQMQEMRE